MASGEWQQVYDRLASHQIQSTILSSGLLSSLEDMQNLISDFEEGKRQILGALDVGIGVVGARKGVCKRAGVCIESKLVANMFTDSDT